VGVEIDRDEFGEDEFERFEERLQASLAALAELLSRPGFGKGAATTGAELELCLVDAAARPLLRNLDVLADCTDERVTTEFSRFNLEVCTHPRPLAGEPFRALGAQFEELLAHIGGAAERHGGRIVAVGILPTLATPHVQTGAMTDLARYRALSRGIRRLRNAPFSVEISGADPLALEVDDVTCEGAMTSLQLHLRVEPADYVDSYNAAQLATAPVLAAAGNSPVFLGHRLWEETRVALYKQAVDERDDVSESWRPARVSFGNGWAREGPLELFAETVALHPPLLPVLSDEDPLERLRAGGVPRLSELRLHHGTVWRWNRAIFDPADGGHLRIELRALPAGPSVIDMQANLAFLTGLTLGLRAEADWMTAALPFRHAERNFYRAAQHGLDAMLLWPSRRPPSPQPVRARTLIHRLLPVARRGLAEAGVASEEAEPLLALIAARVDVGQTGARWQRAALEQLEADRPREAALEAMLERYLEHAASGAPAHTWPLPRP
jgi:gamma-glutamyl:cysteine ligase YbdK (ATP-grasp superfamily)